MLREPQEAFAPPADMWFTFFRGKGRRHFVHEIPFQTLKICVYRVRVAGDYTYEHDLFMRVKYDWHKIGTVRQQDIANLIRLLTLASSYINGLK